MAEAKKKTAKKKELSPKDAKKAARREFAKKRREKIRQDSEFAKGYFEGKSKRSSDRKVAFRKRHTRKS